jgi:phosphoribosylformimino-5-aminoimidazole carboxamide ribotide isomerase
MRGAVASVGRHRDNTGMRILGVLDLMRGVVVRGVAGRREQYAPIVSRLCSSSRPAEVARALVEQLGLTEVYLADLDAIAGMEPALAAYEEVRAAGVHLWIDAGVRQADDARRLAAFGTPVVGLETLAGPDVLRELGAECVFSLDLRAGEPLGDLSRWRGRDAWNIAAEAIGLGVRRLLVLDLARVGVGTGTGTEEFCARLSAQYPDVEVAAGGGVRGLDDLLRLSACGVKAALVASALHDGRLTRADLDQARHS